LCLQPVAVEATEPAPPIDGLLEFLGRGDDEKAALSDWPGVEEATAPANEGEHGSPPPPTAKGPTTAPGTGRT